MGQLRLSPDPNLWLKWGWRLGPPMPSLLGKPGQSPDQSPRLGRGEGSCLEGTKLDISNLSKPALRLCAPSRSSVPRFTQQLGHQVKAALPFFASALSAPALGDPLSSFPKSQPPRLEWRDRLTRGWNSEGVEPRDGALRSEGIYPGLLAARPAPLRLGRAPFLSEAFPLSRPQTGPSRGRCGRVSLPVTGSVAGLETRVLGEGWEPPALPGLHGTGQDRTGQDGPHLHGGGTPGRQGPGTKRAPGGSLGSPQKRPEAPQASFTPSPCGGLWASWAFDVLGSQ